VKFYSESLRRLSRMGVTFLIISVVMTVVLGIKDYVGVSPMSIGYLGNTIQMMPVLPYYVFAAGLGFAFLGFSFLDKRAESDFYHSIPISRSDLYISVTLASFTWMGVTIVINALVSVLMLALMGVPFVPAYLPLGIFLFLGAGMLIFAAAAIGCCLTGTLFTNVIMTGLVLFLPRFVLFVIARGIVAGTNIIGWLDLPGWLQPDMNAATGLIVMLSRNMYYARIANVGTIVYSIALAALELGLGWVLFRKRPSELAEQGARSRKMQTLFACVVAFPVALLSLVPTVSMNLGLKAYLTSYSALISIAALAVYVVYQIIVLRNTKRMVRSLPWFACTLAATVLMALGIRGGCQQALSRMPSADEISYVVFEGHDSDSAVPSYSTLLLSRIHFTEESVKNLVADTLRNASSKMLQQISTGRSEYQVYSEYETIERVRIVLKNGQVIRRGITFDNLNSLNDVRGENVEFRKVIRTVPEDASVHRLLTYYGDEVYSPEDIEKLRVSYNAEMLAANSVVPTYYRTRTASADSTPYSVNEAQNYGDFSIGGYLGTRRYLDYYTVNLETPKTASLLMMLNNRFADGNNMARLKAAYDQIHISDQDNDYFNMSLTFTNLPAENGERQQISLGYYANVYDLKNGASRSTRYGAGYAEACIRILQRAKLTSNSTGFNVSLNWNCQLYGTSESNSPVSVYYAFTPEDEAEMEKIAREWYEADYNGYADAMAKEEAPLADTEASATPIPLPAG
jgi:ABC-2 type transport system permease protein